MGQSERKGHDEDDEDRDHRAKEERDDRSTLTQPARRYAPPGLMDAQWALKRLPSCCDQIMCASRGWAATIEEGLLCHEFCGFARP